ncbi:MAG: polysaccharide biosynthesis protein [Rikenellaceae bacterium]|nr:polysaccharide biosynthesis protein [Rikenellaceae bacterium]
MLEKLAKQTAIYGISTIVVRFLSYLLTPVYTYTFSQATYGIVTDIYALIPFALVLLSMGMESSFFRFTAKAEAEGTSAEDVAARKRRVFATTWGANIVAALIFFLVVVVCRRDVAHLMGAAYEAHPEYVVMVAAIILVDVATMIPFSRLREQGRALRFVALKAVNVVVNVGLAIAFLVAGLYDTAFGVGWVFVANLVASVVTLLLILPTTEHTLPRIERSLLRKIFIYSLPLLIGGVAGTAGEFLDRQMIKYLLPDDISMAQLGVYGAITKIAVVMTLFTQMYRLAAEPFFLSNFTKEEFVESNAAALKYFVMASMLIFLGIALFRDVFALIVGRDFREGIDILPVVLGANILAGVWLNLSFWYKREEKTQFALYVTFTGLAVVVVLGLLMVPRWGYRGAAWARLGAEAAMVVVSLWLNRRYFPTPYDFGRIAEYVVAGVALYLASEALLHYGSPTVVMRYGVNVVLFMAFVAFAVWREKIDVKGLARSVMKRR